MGLTIHWELRGPANATPAGIKAICKKLRSAAMDLPFDKVGPIRELIGESHCNPEYHRKPDRTNEEEELMSMAIGGSCGYSIKKKSHGDSHVTYHYPIQPLHIIGFEIWVARGCEPMDIVFGRYPESISRYDEYQRHRTWKTRLQGWHGRSFSKTQYASDPSVGGIPNFLLAHGGIVAMLDKAKELGVLKWVSDEGHFWEKRNVPALVKQIGEWNAFVAGFAGAMKDAIGRAVPGAELVSPIMERPDFEDLEMKGQKIGNLPAFVKMMAAAMPPAGDRKKG